MSQVTHATGALPLGNSATYSSGVPRPLDSDTHDQTSDVVLVVGLFELKFG